MTHPVSLVGEPAIFLTSAGHELFWEFDAAIGVPYVEHKAVTQVSYTQSASLPTFIRKYDGSLSNSYRAQITLDDDVDVTYRIYGNEYESPVYLREALTASDIDITFVGGARNDFSELPSITFDSDLIVCVGDMVEPSVLDYNSFKDLRASIVNPTVMLPTVYETRVQSFRRSFPYVHEGPILRRIGNVALMLVPAIRNRADNDVSAARTLSLNTDWTSAPYRILVLSAPFGTTYEQDKSGYRVIADIVRPSAIVTGGVETYWRGRYAANDNNQVVRHCPIIATSGLGNVRDSLLDQASVLRFDVEESVATQHYVALNATSTRATITAYDLDQNVVDTVFLVAELIE